MTGATTLDFSSDFTVTESPTGEANIVPVRAAPVSTGTSNQEGTDAGAARPKHVHALGDHAHAGAAGDGGSIDASYATDAELSVHAGAADPHTEYQKESLLTTLGDMVYATASAVWARLAGNTATTRKVLTQTGDGAASAAPVWGAVGIADDNIVEVDGTPVDNEYAKWTAAGLEGRTEAEFKGDFNLEDADINTLAIAAVQGEATLDLAGDVDIAKHLAVGANASISTTNIVDIEEEFTAAENRQGMALRIRHTPGANNANWLQGWYALVQVAGNYNKTGAVNVIRSYFDKFGTGTASLVRMFMSTPALLAGTITELRHWEIEDTGGSGSLGTQVGLYINELGYGDVNIPIYSLGGDSRHVGRLKLGADSAPDVSAALDVESTNRGVLIPRMTTTQETAIATPATSLIVFNTTLSRLRVYF